MNNSKLSCDCKSDKLFQTMNVFVLFCFLEREILSFQKCIAVKGWSHRIVLSGWGKEKTTTTTKQNQKQGNQNKVGEKK